MDTQTKPFRIDAAYLPQPEPGLTPTEIIRRAIELRPLLLEDQANSEARGTYSLEMHERFRKAGFYRILQPKMYGGYEFDLTVFARVIMEIARGCPGTGWGLCLASAHALNAAAIFSQEGQDILFGSDGEFAASARGMPTGTATETDEGWIINGVWDYCSGSPHSNYAMVGVRIVSEDPSLPPALGVVAVPRSQWTMLDNWRGYIGLAASGSNSIEITNALVPKPLLVRQNFFALNIDGGTEGYHIHNNPMYSGRMFGFFQTEITSILVGLGFAALDEFERIMKLKMAAPAGPPGVGGGVQDFLRPYGLALGMLETARNAVISGAQSYLDYCEAGLLDPSAYTEVDDMRIQAGLQHAARLSGDVVDLLYTSVGTSMAAKNGSRLQRYFRDMSMARTNPGLAYERTAAQLASRTLSERTAIRAG
ncbi:acyl-CoA dehydrogenase family protein [Xanthobacter autotrophicus]|uniref:acyl-CoA dehydrogenase family protein n=1 Tax=Xanthobacter autotrophicus TaxID=280 RepID=UPI0024A76FE7|nr:acyl-CoA dehydrogenase family protein [Xanthobacter autotrophicus]MDI4655325.1 acyl-CoA dehydrogenase family protein [Xanthobacter autotrophicus]